VGQIGSRDYASLLPRDCVCLSLCSVPIYGRSSVTSDVCIGTGAKVKIDKATSNGFFIYTTISETCEHPRDYIYMPWGYSPWINASPNLHSAWRVAMALAVAILTVSLTSL
jgi:hypothetical protein